MENKEVELCKTCKQPLTTLKYGGKSRFHEDHDPILCLTNMMRELLDKHVEGQKARLKQSCFPKEFVLDILSLLDHIEVDDDVSLTSQRFAIAEKHGMTVVFEEPVSGRMN